MGFSVVVVGVRRRVGRVCDGNQAARPGLRIQDRAFSSEIFGY